MIIRQKLGHVLIHRYFFSLWLIFVSMQVEMSLPADEFEQNLIKSIDTLLEENSSQLVEHIQDGIVCEAIDVWPTVVPKYKEDNSLLIDGQTYVKWSTVDSDEQIWPRKPSSSSITVNHATSHIGRVSLLHQQSQQYIAAAMNHTQQILNQYQNLWYQYNLIRNGRNVPNIGDCLIYSMNPNYADIGNLLNASPAFNWNMAASTNYSNHIKMANQLLMQYNRGRCAGKYNANSMQIPKMQ